MMADRSKWIGRLPALTARGDAAGAVLACEMALNELPSDAELAEAERLMTDLCRRVTGNAAAFCLLGELRARLEHQRGAAEAWQKAIALDPGNARAHVRLALLMTREFSFYDQSLAMMRRAEAAAWDSFPDLKELADGYMHEERFADAVRVFARILDIAAESQLDLVVFTLYLRALRELKRSDAAAAVRAQADQFIGGDGGCFLPRAESADCLSKPLARARIAYAAGARAEVLSGLRGLYSAERGQRFDYSADDYLPDTAGRLRRLRRRIEGRDVVIFLPGPSLKALKPHAADLCATEAFFAGMNKFDEIAAALLAPHGRTMDAVLLVDRLECLRRHQALSRWLAGGADRWLLSRAGVWSHLSGADNDLAQTYDETPERFIWLSARSAAPPSFRDPLNIPHINTFGALVPMMAVCAPRRIFIFGADGGRQAGSGSDIYFHAGTALDPHKLAPLSEVEVENEKNRYAARLAREARHFDEQAPFVMHALSALHDVPVPETYNCCPGSGYRAFPQISIEEAMERLCGDSA